MERAGRELSAQKKSSAVDDVKRGCVLKEVRATKFCPEDGDFCKHGPFAPALTLRIPCDMFKLQGSGGESVSSPL